MPSFGSRRRLLKGQTIRVYSRGVLGCQCKCYLAILETFISPEAHTRLSSHNATDAQQLFQHREGIWNDTSLLASSPSDFKECGDITVFPSAELRDLLDVDELDDELSITNVGVRIAAVIQRSGQSSLYYRAYLPCGLQDRTYICALDLDRTPGYGQRFTRVAPRLGPRLLQIRSSLVNSLGPLECCNNRLLITRGSRADKQPGRPMHTISVELSALRKMASGWGFREHGHGTRDVWDSRDSSMAYIQMSVLMPQHFVWFFGKGFSLLFEFNLDEERLYTSLKNCLRVQVYIGPEQSGRSLALVDLLGAYVDNAQDNQASSIKSPFVSFKVPEGPDILMFAKFNGCDMEPNSLEPAAVRFSVVIQEL